VLTVGTSRNAVEVASHPSQRFAARQEVWCRCILGRLPSPDDLAGVELTLDKYKAPLAGTRHHVRL
jgi:hypothetical protein